MVKNYFEQYESALNPYRKELEQSIYPLLKEKDPQKLLLFWINCCAQAVQMTEPVESWINRAGEKCVKLGYNALGEQLVKHSEHESDHHLMMIDDTKSLVQQWNKSYKPLLDEKKYAHIKPTKSVKDYIDLHENYIKGSAPYCQIAIEYEIEGLSTREITKLLNLSIDNLGEDIKNSLTFVCHHVALDVGHTEYNRKCIGQFLDQYPQTLGDIIDAGRLALNIYTEFLLECYQNAQMLVIDDYALMKDAV